MNINKSEQRQLILENFKPFLNEFELIKNLDQPDIFKKLITFEEKWGVEVDRHEGEASFRQVLIESPARLWGTPFELWDHEQNEYKYYEQKLLVQIDLDHSQNDIIEEVKKLIKEYKIYNSERKEQRERSITTLDMVKILSDYYLDSNVKLSDIIKRYDFSSLQHSGTNLVETIQKSKLPYFEHLLDPKGIILDRKLRKIIDYKSKHDFFSF